LFWNCPSCFDEDGITSNTNFFSEKKHSVWSCLIVIFLTDWFLFSSMILNPTSAVTSKETIFIVFYIFSVYKILKCIKRVNNKNPILFYFSSQPMKMSMIGYRMEVKYYKYSLPIR